MYCFDDATLWIKTVFFVCLFFVFLSDAVPAGGTTPQMHNSSPPSSTATDLPAVGGDTEEEDGMKHLQQVSVSLSFVPVLYERSTN